MLQFFRRLSKSTVGTLIMAVFLILILIGFAMGDIQNIISGGSFGGGSDVLARAGSQQVTDRDMSRAMERRLSQVRQQNPQAEYSTIASEFELLLNALIDARVVEAFADKFGFVLSKRLVDAQIASSPNFRGLNGQFSEQAYQAFLAQQRMTDEEVRMIIRSDLLQQLLITPAAVNSRVAVGMATPYASMLLEAREGQLVFVPTGAFRAGLNPTQTDIEGFYSANRARYMVPEQRVLRIAKIGPEQVAQVQATDQEIAAYYNANRALYAPKEIRVLSHAILPDQGSAQAIAAKARAGTPFTAAGGDAATSLGEQTREQYASITGSAVAQAVFNAKAGTIVGPMQSDLGWVVAKVESAPTEGGKTLAAAREEIATKITSDKRKEALDALADQVQTALDEGSSFAEAVAAAKLTAFETPPITAAGTSRTNPNYRLPAELAPAVKSGFELAENDEPVVDPLPNDGGYVLVAPARVIAAAPAPLASIRDQVAQDWLTVQATQRARQLADAIAAKANQAPLTEAVRGAPIQLPPVAPASARRIQLSQFEGRVPPPLGLLFSLGQGKARAVGDRDGFYVVKLNRITPGNALNQPTLVGQTQQQLQQAISQEYGLQFLAAIRETVGVKRNEKAIASSKARITGSGG